MEWEVIHGINFHKVHIQVWVTLTRFNNTTEFYHLLQSAIIAKDVDMIVDASLFLWTKCKPHFQKVISSALESCRQILNDAFAHKVLYVHTLIELVKT